MNWELLLFCKFLQRSGELSNKNVNVTTIMFLMSGDLTGLCLYICVCNLFYTMQYNYNDCLYKNNNKGPPIKKKLFAIKKK